MESSTSFKALIHSPYSDHMNKIQPNHGAPVGKIHGIRLSFVATLCPPKTNILEGGTTDAMPLKNLSISLHRKIVSLAQ